MVMSRLSCASATISSKLPSASVGAGGASAAGACTSRGETAAEERGEPRGAS